MAVVTYSGCRLYCSRGSRGEEAEERKQRRGSGAEEAEERKRRRGSGGEEAEERKQSRRSRRRRKDGRKDGTEENQTNSTLTVGKNQSRRRVR